MNTPEEALLGLAFDQQDIKPEHREHILTYLKMLRIRDEATFLHSVRVGLLSQQIAIVACQPGITPKMMLWAGSLHDIGKSLIPSSILCKNHEFTPADAVAMEPHAKYGWDLLNNVHDFTAHVIVRHHQFGSHPYPAELPQVPEYLQPKMEMILMAARLLAMADYYDAMMNRDNDKFGGIPLNAQQKRENYLRDNADQTELIKALEEFELFNFSE